MKLQFVIQNICDSGCHNWLFDYSELDRKTSMQESFNLVCNDEIYLKIHASFYFLGFFLGASVGGYAIDRIGRARWNAIACLVMSVSAVIMAFTNSLLVFLLFWCLVSLLVSSSMLSLFALAAETGKPNDRHNRESIVCSFCVFALPLTSPIAYPFESWRHFLLAGGAFSFLCFIFSLFVDESPKWLWTQKRYEEAIIIIKKAYKLKKCPISVENEDQLAFMISKGRRKENFLKSLLSDCRRLLNIDRKIAECNNSKTQPSKSETIVSIFRYPRLLFRLIVLSIHWSCANTLYYGLAFGADILKQNVYLYVFTQGLGGFIGSVLGFFTFKIFGRKTVSILSVVVSSICVMLCIFIPLTETYIILAITSLAKVTLELFFLLCYLWTADLMPTVIRASGMGVASSVARITGLALPFVGYLSKFGEAAPLVFYTSFGFLTAVLSLMLPESRGLKLPDTLDEGNKFAVKSVKLENENQHKIHEGQYSA